jgi:glutathione S-transferase
MSILLHHHPWSRAATTVWMLEEIGQPYELNTVDLRAGDHHSDGHKSRNRMMKLPVLEDGEAVIAESAAIGVYLADRYALGELAPALDDPRRGPYLRWCFFAPSVIEPATMAKASGWEYSESSAGFGTYENMVATLEDGLSGGQWLLGDQFTMADIIVGATVRFLQQFKMIEQEGALGAYVERIVERPALQRADARNQAVIAELGLA